MANSTSGLGAGAKTLGHRPGERCRMAKKHWPSAFPTVLEVQQTVGLAH